MRAVIIELVCSALSFFATYFVTNDILQKSCARQYPVNADQLETQTYANDAYSDDVSVEKPREECVFSMEPWEVKRRMGSKVFVCPRTSRASPIKVVVIIKSAPSYFDRRDAIRKTWGTISHLEDMVVHYIFIMGTASDDVQLLINRENAVNGDILQYIGVDNYRNVARKVLAGMQWTTKNIGDDYFYATSDDDMIVNMTDIPKLLRLRIKLVSSNSMQNSNTRSGDMMSMVPILCVYSYIEEETPMRDPDSKYFLGVNEYPMDTLPPYCRGGFYMIPAGKVAKLYNISRSHKALPMDDVWITGVLRNLLPRHERSIDAIDESAQNQEQFSNHVTHLMGDMVDGPTVKPEEEVLAKWKEIYQALATKRHCLINEVNSSS